MVSRFTAVVGLVLALLLASVLVPLTAGAADIPAGHGVVTGRISAFGSPIEAMSVQAYATGSDTVVQSSTTTVEGIYTLTLPVGAYNLRVLDPRQRYRYWETKWVGSTDGTRTTAAAIEVTEGSSQSLDEQLVPIVSVFPRAGNDGSQWSGSYRFYARKFDPSTATWSELVELTDKVTFGWRVEPGRYRFLIDPYDESTLPTWYPNTTTFEDATAVDVIVGADPQTFLDYDMVMAQSIQALSPATITGSGWVGEQLTGTGPSWNVAPSGFRTSWVRDDGVVLVDNVYGYTPTKADFGHTISFKVVGSRTSYEPGVSVSSPIAITAMRPVVAPVVQGSNRVGSTLKVTAGRWTHPVASTQYQWTRNGQTISSATRPTYTTSSADVAKTIAVQLTARTEEGRSGTSKATLTGYVKTVSWIAAAKKVTYVNGKRVVHVVGTLHLPGDPNSPGSDGRFKLLRGTTLVTSVAADDGVKLRWRVPARRGEYKLRFTFSGNAVATSATKGITATIA